MESTKQIKIEIRNRWTGSVVFEYTKEGNTITETVLDAIRRGADLRDADLCGADLCGADLCGADLRGSNLCDADLCDANLCGAYLCGANLYGADLRGTNLRGANLRGANLRDAKGCYLSCPTEGSFIGWKKASGHIVKLRIPEDARRSSATGHKCRCDKAYVMEIQNMDGTKATEDTVRADHDKNFVYTVGATVEVPDFDDNRWSECAPGIHFFIDRRAAVEYQ
nr:MAG TPA: pentapeptide repeat protein [Caudoviricetes sp.]